MDDEPIIKVAFRKIIPWEAQGCQIVGTASNGLEALRLLEDMPADIIITDLKMPQMDGIQLIKALREKGFDGVILVLSNYTDFELVREALVAGAMDYMLKVNIDGAGLIQQLGRAVEALGKRRETRRQEQFVAEYSQALRERALKGYLQGGQDTPEEALRDAFSVSRGPYLLCMAVFLSAARQEGMHMPSLSRAEDILRAIFEDVPDTAIMTLEDGAVLCVCPERALRTKGVRMEDKHAQILRQIAMYYNLPVLLLQPDAAQDIDGISARFKACRAASDISFYRIPAGVQDPMKIRFAPLSVALQPKEMAARLSGLHHAGQEEEIAAHVDVFLEACRTQCANPREVRLFWMQVAQEIAAGSAAGGKADGAPPRTAWLECAHEGQLRRMALAFLADTLPATLPPAFAGCKEEVRRALAFAHAHYRERITLEDIAHAASLDRSYLCRLFKRETGFNLFQYVNRLRMEAAAVLIQGGGHTIREVAASVGVDDPFYFTRLFKKHFGVNPTEYRRDAAEEKQ